MWLRLMFLSLLFALPEAHGRDLRRLALNRAPTTPTQRIRAPLPRTSDKKSRLGFLGGFNFSYANTSPSAEGSTRNGVALFVQYERTLTDIFAIEADIAYVQRGVQSTLFEVAGLPIQGTVKLNYLEFPLLLKARSGRKSSVFRAYCSVGPHMAVAVSRGAEVFGLVNVDITNRFRAGDFGFLLSLGADYRVTPSMALQFELRNTFGLVDLDKSGDRYRTRGHQILAGLAWSF